MEVLGVFGETGKKLKQCGRINETACPSENELDVAELLNWRVQKSILHPPIPLARPRRSRTHAGRSRRGAQSANERAGPGNNFIET
jgi:hypothetical protein